MARSRTLVLVLAGGKGGRLQHLTEHRAKPAVPFGGHHRLIDVALSNCARSGVDDVWVSVQHNPVSLVEHLANGRPWDLDRQSGGLLVLHPRTTDQGRGGWSTGTADGLFRDADLIRQHDPEHLVVVSADAVYRLDYEQVVAEHRDADADVTLVSTEVPLEDAGRYGVLQVEGDRVVDYQLKPDAPASSLVCNEIFVMTPAPVLDRLEELAREAGEDGLQDLGHELLPALVGEGRVRHHRIDGYWRDVGTVEAYHAAHQDLVGEDPLFVIDDPRWPLLTRGGRRAPARLLRGAELEDALLSPSSTVSGRVERSVLSPGVVVERGAVVRSSVLLHDVVVRAGAVVEGAVLDRGVEVLPDGRVGGPGAVALVGADERVQELEAGGRLPAV